MDYPQSDRLFFTAEGTEFTVWCYDFKVYINEISPSFVVKVLYSVLVNMTLQSDAHTLNRHRKMKRDCYDIFVFLLFVPQYILFANGVF